MHPTKTRHFTLFAVAILSAASVRSETCYSYMGFEVEDQQVCKGSGACCGINDECMPNRLCKGRGAADNVLVRGPCSSKSWDKERNCAEICNFNEIEQNTGLQDGVFPRVEICDEGVYCCRQGSASCCDRESRLVYLNEDGVRLSEPPSSTTSITSEAEAEATSTEAASTTTSEGSDLKATETGAMSEEDSNNKEDNGDNSLGLKVGLGVGIPLAILVTALATWWFTSKRQKSMNSQVGSSQPPYEQAHTSAKEQSPPQGYIPYGQMAQPHYLGAMRRDAPGPHELESPPNAR